MDETCLKCPASLACLTERTMLRDRKRPGKKTEILVFVPAGMFLPGNGVGVGTEICLAPKDCPGAASLRSLRR